MKPDGFAVAAETQRLSGWAGRELTLRAKHRKTTQSYSKWGCLFCIRCHILYYEGNGVNFWAPGPPGNPGKLVAWKHATSGSLEASNPLVGWKHAALWLEARNHWLVGSWKHAAHWLVGSSEQPKVGSRKLTPCLLYPENENGTKWTPHIYFNFSFVSGSKFIGGAGT